MAVKYLDNESTPIPGHPKWGICGTDDPSSRKSILMQHFDTLINMRTINIRDTYSIVFRKVEQVYFILSLMLAGHTHGGQIRIGKLGLLEKGSFQIDGGRAKLISNGYGTSTLPLRLGARPECHIIKINY